MSAEKTIQERHLEVLESLGTLTDTLAGVERIPEGEHKTVVEDNPSKSYVLNGAGQRTAVLIVSNDVNPDFVGRAVERTALAKSSLGPSLGEVIIEPLAAGTYSGCSFAVWPLLGELSSWRGLRYFQKRLLAVKALAWLRETTEHTQALVKTGELEAAFVRPLTSLADEGRLPDEIRQSARVAIERIQSQRWRPRVALTHGDLWLGNFLMPTRNSEAGKRHGFVVIDWAGARIPGCPLYDLLRLSRSIGISARSLRREVLLHSEILSCEPVDTRSYLLAALGEIGLDLEHFPFERYLSMCENLYAHLSSVLDDSSR
jgi:hypothetical protein